MSTLVAMMFDSYADAQRVRLEFSQMQREHLVELEDIVVVHRDHKGHVKLDQSLNLTASSAAAGGFWGLLIGALFTIPFGGAVLPLFSGLVGAGLGAIGGKLSDYGIDDQMMKDVGAGLEQGKGALFVLVRRATLDKVLAHLSRFEGKVLKTSLSNDLEQQLRAAIEHPRQTGADVADSERVDRT